MFLKYMEHCPWISTVSPSIHSIKMLVIFDIDGTLIEAGDLHSRAYEYTFKEVFHINQKLTWPNFQGRTDPWILIELARLNGVSEKEINEKIELAKETMVQYYWKHRHEEHGQIHPGVKDLLSEIDKKNYLRGLATGNLEALAYLKLKFFGIEKGFFGGGFGTDHIERSELILKTIRDAQANWNYKWNGKNAVYIADTPLDVVAAHKAGVSCIVTKTSAKKDFDFSIDPPELLVNDLSDTKKIIEYIESLFE